MKTPPQPAVNPLQKYRNRIIGGIVLAIAIYALVLLLLDGQGQITATEGVLQALADFPFVLVPVLILCQVLVIIFRFIEWHYYLGVIDARDKISLGDSLVIFISGFTMVVSPGKAAEVLKAVFLKAKTGVPIAHGASVVLAERIVDGLAVIVLMTGTLLVAGDNLQLGQANGIDYDSLTRTLIFSSAGMLAFGLVAVQIRPLAYFFLALIGRIPYVRRLYDPLVDFYESSREIFKLKHVIPMTVVGTGVYAASSAGFYFILVGYGLEPTWGLFLQAAFITGVVSAIGALSFLPNGAGITEISTMGMLLVIIGPLYPALMTPAVAAAASLLQGFFHKWFRVLVGMAVMFFFRHRLFSEDFQDALRAYEALEDKTAKPAVSGVA